MNWKIVIIPYILIALWLAFSFYLTVSKGIAGIAIGPVFMAYGIAALIAYTAILGVSALIRKILKK